ncbi:hypothetical protein [Solibacillus sp. FSL W8-0372]|uniref:hypothetical protein n=1 Tax=Solibacillus sp. FSL W8-0372 TaxID=2921713 RepID=UPI0030CE3F5E
MTDSDNKPVEFAKIFETFNIQTDGSTNVQEYSQNSTGRIGGDFGVNSITHKGTKIYADGTDLINEEGTLYYGLHSNIAGVNFEANAIVKINLTGTLKPDVIPGEYKVTVTMYGKARKDINNKFANKEELEGNSNVLGSVEYTLTVPSSLE